MSQHDFVLDNATGAAFRADLNAALLAVISQSSGTSEPATMYAYQFWADTTTGLLKIRNAANNAWITIGTLAAANLGLLPLSGGTMTGSILVGTTYSYDIGAITAGLRALYLGSDDSAAKSTKIKSGAVGSSWTLTLPVDSGGSVKGVMENDGAGVTSWKARSQKVYQSKTTTYTALLSDDVIFASNTGSAWTLSLPTAVGNGGKEFEIINNGTSYANAITIDPNSSETVGGASTTTLNTPGESIIIVSDNSNWLIKQRHTATAWATGGSVNWTTNTTSAVKWRRIGDSMEVQAHAVLSGAPDNATFLVTLPNSLTMDTGKLAGSTATSNVGQALGSGFTLDASAGIAYSLVPTPNSSTTVLLVMTYGSGVTSIVAQSVPFVYANNDRVSVMFKVPISGWNS